MLRLIGIMRLAGSVLLVAVVLLMSADAGLRYLFRAPIFGAQDLLSTGLLLVFTLGLADSWLARSHVRMDLAYDLMPLVLRRAVDVLSLLIAAALAGALCWGGYHAFRNFSRFGAATPLLGIPQSLLAAIVAIGALCFALAILYDAWLMLAGRTAPSPATTEAE